jgi:hypothetical protein
MTGTTRMTAERTGTPGTAHIIQGGGRRRAEQLALLSLAMIAGVIGFVLVVFWGIALILLGILWGMMAMERQRLAEPERGVLAEVVDVVVDAAKNVASSGSRHDVSDEPPRRVASSTGSRPDAPDESLRRVASSTGWRPDAPDVPPRRVAD